MRNRRKNRHDYWRRMKIFISLSVGILVYGAEVWRWTEKAELERIQR